jgi:hypothetical protein
MFFLMGLHPEIYAAIHKGIDHLTFDACLGAVVEAETALRLETEYNKSFKSTSKGLVVAKTGKNQSKGKAHYNFSKDLAHRTHRSPHAEFFVVVAVAVATMAMAEAASSNS